MLRESEFIRQLRTLLAQRVHGIDQQDKVEIIQRLAEETGTPEAATRRAECHWVPFVTGRRPVDEAAYPGLGSSDHAALLLDPETGVENRTYLLYAVDLAGVSAAERARYDVRVTLSLAGPWGDENHPALPAWNRRPIAPQAFLPGPDGRPVLSDVPLGDTGGRSHVLALDPLREFLPGESWSWNDVDPAIRDAATDANDPFTFGHLFLQQIRAEVVLCRDGVPVSADDQRIDVCDARRFGSLYRRVVERAVQPSTAAQAAAAGLPTLDLAYHPWFPVLHIGSDKALLYTRALIEDIVRKKRHLTDPRWLLRVGLYLEFLTCLGIFEAVREELGDLLTPAERAAYDASPRFARLREAVDVRAWREVWELRRISLPQVGTPSAGPVSTLNLLTKKKATLAFLETHHEDLKRAIEMAGPNEHNAQETWHRVFRDAERAVLRKTPSAFPELSALGAKAQEFVLWHRKGRIGGLSLPGGIAGWFGDQDGLYASACNQYRASMNHVAEWAKARALMDHAGEECVPEQVSLLRAFMEGRHVRLGQLQRRDGYAGTIDVAADLPPDFALSRGRIDALLENVPLFSPLTVDERTALAATARGIELGPVERIIVQGRPGTSLFVVAEGRLEVLVRQSDGVDLPVAFLDEGAVFGEMSLLTGEPRSATVRSIDPAVVLEIGQRQLAPILKSRPVLIDEMAALMESRQRANVAAATGREARKELASLGRRIRAFLAGIG